MEVSGNRFNIESNALKISFEKETDDKANICFLNDNEGNQGLIKNKKPMKFKDIFSFMEKITLEN